MKTKRMISLLITVCMLLTVWTPVSAQEQRIQANRTAFGSAEMAAPKREAADLTPAAGLNSSPAQADELPETPMVAEQQSAESAPLTLRAQSSPLQEDIPGYQTGHINGRTYYARTSGFGTMFYMKNSRNMLARVSAPYLTDAGKTRYYPINYGGQVLFPRLENGKVTAYCTFKDGSQVPAVSVARTTPPDSTDEPPSTAFAGRTYYAKTSGFSTMFYLENSKGVKKRVSAPYIGNDAGTRFYPVNLAGSVVWPRAGGSSLDYVAADGSVALRVQRTSYTVSFHRNDGSGILHAAIPVASGETASAPAQPIREGYTFAGWCTDAEGNNFYEFETAVNDNVMLYAKWAREADAFAVSFHVNRPDVSDPPPQTVQRNGCATMPKTSERAGFQFAGWFLSPDEADLTKPFSFDTPITQDVSLYAIWIDLTTDTDGDGLSDDLEKYAGTSRVKPDTDEDGLTDYQEAVILGTDPLLPDTDGDGMLDFDEDKDGDGIPNGREFALGTDPVQSDTDKDGLSDSDELDRFSTDPLSDDSDGDGAADKWELDNKFNPLEYNAQFTVEIPATEPSEAQTVTAGVKVDVDGKGVESLDVQPVEYSDNPFLSASVAGYLGTAYDFVCDEEISSASLVFQYNEQLGTVGDDFQPRIYFYNDADQTFEELPNQTVENGIVTAPVSHFSTYILLNKVEFDRVWEAEIKPPITTDKGEAAYLDMVFVVDYSASMETNDPDKIFADLSKQFVDKLRPGMDRAAVVKFIRRATVMAPLTTDKSELYEAISGIRYDDGYGSFSGTDGSTGLKAALDLLAESDSTHKYIVFMTDGEDNAYSYPYDSLITSCIEQGIKVYTVGLGSAVEDVLRQIASSTGGVFYRATASEDLTSNDLLSLDEVYKDIEANTIDLTTDSNNDGIPDYYNDLIFAGKLPVSNGSTQFKGINFNESPDGNPINDWDGDGLKNGEELKIVHGPKGTVLVMTSNPLLSHSDMDCVGDYQEVQRGTNPLVYEASRALVDFVREDGNYFYEGLAEETDENLLLKFDLAALSVIFHVDNRQEIYRKVLADYFSEYSKVLVNENLEAEQARKIALNILDDISGKLEKTDEFLDLNTDIIALTSKLKGTADPKMIHHLVDTSCTEVFKRVSAIRPDLDTISLPIYSMKEQTLRLLDAGGDKLGAFAKGVKIAVYIKDLGVDTIAEVANVNTNSAAFEANMDLLRYVADSSDDPDMSAAASTVMKSLSEEFGTVLSGILDAVVGDAIEIVVEAAISLLAKANPYVLAAVVVRDIIGLVTGIEEDLELHHEMIAYERLASALNALLSQTAIASGSYYRVDEANTKTFERNMGHLMQIRLLGEKKYVRFREKKGLLQLEGDQLKNQIPRINAEIDVIQNIASQLGVKIAYFGKIPN